MGAISGTLVRLNVNVRRGVTIFSRGGPRYLCISFKTFKMQTIAMPFCTADSRTRMRCVMNSTRVHCVFMNRRLRCSITFQIVRLKDRLGRVVVFSERMGHSRQSRASVCFSSFLGLNRTRPRRTRMSGHASRSNGNSLTGVLCADKAAKSDGKIVLRRSYCRTTVPTRSRHFPRLNSRSIVVGFLPFARIFRHT